tara:strand:- start:227 stop:424 length:198 start_codon:yes stop_codon:yes gene_type:complete
MAIKIKFEDVHGKTYKTPVIEDTDAIYKRPSVLTDDDEYDYNRKRNQGRSINFTKGKKKTNSVNA